jgi:predicted esterase YcpF (UPF0227 family)
MTTPPHPPASHPGQVTHLLYLHGFRSSPQSAKARQMAARVAAINARQPGRLTWWCPQLPPSPAAAVALLRGGIASWPAQTMAVIGSSLGGFYATCLAEQQGCRAVVLNPAVHPARDLARHIGAQTAWHDPDQGFYFEPDFIGELQALEAGPLVQPARYFGVIAKGDELLDWREMTARYAGSHTKLLPASDHALSDFDAHIDDVLAFLGLDDPPSA